MYSHQEIPEKKVVKIQRQFRATSRQKLHLGIFGENPQSSWPELPMIPAWHQSDLHYRLEKIIANITEHQKIVNGKRLYHYSRLSNLASICRHEKLFGHDNLLKNNIAFQKNAFTQFDRDNGDSRVICFCPGQVDRTAYADYLGVTKPDSCCLTIDINNRYSKDGIHSDFFKLADLAIHFTSQINFGDLSILITKNHSISLRISFKFKNHNTEHVDLTKSEMIFYGNIFCINRFCAVQLFKLIGKLQNDKLQGELFVYLNDLNDHELTKLLIVFSQNLTIFAEYNFTDVLPLSDIIIKEILIIGDKKIKYDFSNTSDWEYSRALDLLSKSDYSQLKHYVKPVDAQDTIYNTAHQYTNLRVFGTVVSNSAAPDLKINALNLSGDLFTTNDYIETRMGVSNSILLENTGTDNTPQGLCMKI